jgi:hypothetical protein
MRLSISSSDDRIPRGPWLRPIVGAVLLVVALVGAWEWAVRQKGFEPAAVVDSKELWIETRQRATQLGEYGVVLVGASRMLFDINIDALTKYTATAPVQLAIVNNPFWPVFEDLANDESIKGTVIVEITIQAIDPVPTTLQARDWLDAYHRLTARHAQPYFKPMESILRDRINKAFAYRSAGARPQHVLLNGWFDPTAYQRYWKMGPDRAVQADYSKIDVKRAYREALAADKGRAPVAFVDIPDFAGRLAALEKLVQKIQRRGGRVVFIHFPISKELKTIEYARYPRAHYWDRLVRETSAQTVHFEDYPGLSRYELPDGMHLDFRQAIPFTQTLGSILFPAAR